MDGTQLPGCSLQGRWVLLGSMESHWGSKGYFFQGTLGLRLRVSCPLYLPLW